MISPLQLTAKEFFGLSSSLVLLYTGRRRSANQILTEQKQATEKNNSPALDALHRVKEMVPEVKRILEMGDFEALGAFLHNNWIEKKQFASGVSNTLIDSYYEQALELGAWGGKICGAGGGGFLLICCPAHRLDVIIQELEAKGLRQMPFSIDYSGARVLMNAGLRFTSRHAWLPPQSLYQGI